MKKINCVYVSNKYMLRSLNLRDIFDEHFYFNADEFFRRISKEDDTNQELSIDAVNAFIYKKIQRALTINEYHVIYYVFRNMENSVIRDIHKMIRQIHGPHFEFNIFISKDDMELLFDIPKKILDNFDNLIVFDYEEKVNHVYNLDDGLQNINFNQIKKQYVEA